MSTPNDLTVVSVVVCDDVRREITGKDILIGVYTSGITIPTLPASINLCFWMEVTPKKAGKVSVEMRVESPNNAPPATIRIDAEVTNAGESFSIFTPQAQFLIQNSGEIRMSMRTFGQDRWRLVKKIAVNYRQGLFLPTSSASSDSPSSS